MSDFRAASRGRTRRSLSRGLLAVAATLLVAAAAQGQVDPGSESCGASEREPVASLAWVELPTPDSEALGTALHLRVTSLVDVPADLRVGVIADVGGPERVVQRARVPVLAARGTTDVLVDLAALKLDTDAMAFAGQITALVRVTPQGACAGRVCRKPKQPRPGARPRPVPEVVGEGPTTLASAPVFFHRAAVGDPFAIYGENLLVSRHGAGDLHGDFDLEPGATLVRATDSGRGGSETIGLKRETATVPVDEELGDLSGGPIPITEHRICVKFDIALGDAGKSVVNQDGYTISEDYWNGSASNSGDILKLAPGFSPSMSVAARGVGIEIRLADGWSGLSHTDPATGCITIHADVNPPFDFRVYADFEDKADNRVRIVDGAAKAFYWSTKVSPKKPGSTTTLHVGGYTGRATLAATAGFAMYRSAFGNSGKQIDITESSFCGDPGGAENSAHYDFADLADGLAHVRIHDGSNPDCDPDDSRRFKFTIAHEMGHAWLLLRTAVEEPSTDVSLVDASETVCTINAEGYSLGSVEYSAIGFREGSAHFYAARVWNDPDTEAVFTWFGAASDVESNNPDVDGGRLFNVCTITTTFGRSTNLDWLRFWWDWYSPPAVGKAPGFNQVAQFYQDTIAGGGLGRENYWQQLRTVVAAAAPTSLAAFDCASSWNGIDNSGLAVNCNSVPTPP